MQQHHEGERGTGTLCPTAAFGYTSAFAAAKPAEPACLPAGSWGTSTLLGNLDGTGQGHPHLLPHWLRRGWGEFTLGLGRILPPLPRAAVLTPLETQFHLSTVKIDAGDQPQIPLLSFLGFFQRKTVLLRVPLKDETQSFQVISKSDNVTMCCS